MMKSQNMQIQQKKVSMTMKENQIKHKQRRLRKILTKNEDDENINNFVNQSQQTQKSTTIFS